MIVGEPFLALQMGFVVHFDNGVRLYEVTDNFKEAGGGGSGTPRAGG